MTADQDLPPPTKTSHTRQTGQKDEYKPKENWTQLDQGTVELIHIIQQDFQTKKMTLKELTTE